MTDQKRFENALAVTGIPKELVGNHGILERINIDGTTYEFKNSAYFLHVRVGRSHSIPLVIFDQNNKVIEEVER